MDPELLSLVRLQKNLNEQLRLRRRLREIPEEVTSLKQQQEALAQRRKEEEEAFHEMESRERKCERDLAATEDAIVKKQTALHEVKTNKEYTAALHEIETLKKKKSELEEEALVLMDRISSEKDELRQRLTGLEQEEKGLGRRIEEVTGEVETAKKRIEELAAEAPKSQNSIMPELLERFKKLYHSKNGLAVVAVQDGACTGCQIALSPQTLSAAGMGDRIVSCDHCGRILYADDGSIDA
jgi:predicted  nucleic acid-binding Zn-ribbon protein